MKSRRRGIAIAAVTTVLLIAVAGPVAQGSGDACDGTTQLHPPIHIEGDEGFKAPGSGVVSGSGTAEDPYVICGWNIRPVGAPGIRVQDTTAHVIVRDNHVHDSIGAYSYQMYLLGEARVHVASGLHVENATRVQAFGNRIQGIGDPASPQVVTSGDPNWYFVTYATGILVLGAEGVTLRDNAISETTAHEITILLSRDVDITEHNLKQIHAHGNQGLRVRGNTFEGDTGNALWVAESPGTLIEENRFLGPSLRDVFIRKSDEVSITGNEFTGGHVANVHADRSEGLVIRASNLLGPAAYGVTTSGPAVDARENWWGCAAGPGEAGCTAVDGDVLTAPWLTEPAV